ncbi:MAG: transporter substrate-binding domain-containing protein [Candidatus Hydrogenedens sp.]|nr:transporter substrate-binding domain-containing protein [Candidatus Hydrogenedens sp.]
MRSVLIPVFLMLLGSVASAQAPISSDTLIVGTRHLPPFAIQSEDGTWSGLTVELWKRIAADLGLSYEFRAMPLETMLESLADGSVDVVAAALTTTAEREEVFDFSQPYFNSGLGIAVVPETRSLLGGLVKRLFSAEFLQVLAALSGILLLVGGIIWLIERRHNTEHFGGTPIEGLASGFWWAGVTMTTVGYGDKAPQTIAGRVLAMVWMFASVIMISAFTAAIASSLALGQLDAAVLGPQDLGGNYVGTVGGSTSEVYLRRLHAKPVQYETAELALEDLAGGRTKAVVYDAPLLSYLVNENYGGTIEVLPHRFENQNYAFGLPSGSPLREPLNRALLQQIAHPSWHDLLASYLGEA